MVNEEELTPQNVVGDAFLTVAEASQFLNVTPQTIYQLRSAEKIPYKRIGGKVIFSQKQLYEWVMSGEAAK